MCSFLTGKHLLMRNRITALFTARKVDLAREFRVFACGMVSLQRVKVHTSDTHSFSLRDCLSPLQGGFHTIPHHLLYRPRHITLHISTT